MGILFIIIVVCIILKGAGDYSYVSNMNRKNKEMFWEVSEGTDKMWKKKAKDNNWYYGPGMSGMGPDTTRNYDGTPKK